MNNLSYSIILSFSSDLARDFNQQKLMGLLSGAMVFLSVIGRVVYSKYGLRYKHKSKIVSVILMWTAAILILFLAKLFSSFALVLASCLLIGLGTSIGSLVVVGFIKCFPASIFSGFSAGTGFAGVLGAVLYLLLKLFRFSFDSILLVNLLFYPFFGLAFYAIVHIKVLITQKGQEHSILNGPTNNFEDDPSNEVDLSSLSQQTVAEDVEENEAKINEELSLANIRHINSVINSYLWAFYLLYICEYISITEIGEQVSLKYKHMVDSDDLLLVKTKFLFFEIIQLCYQTGLFFGRGSLDLCKIKQVFVIILFLGVSAGSLLFQIYSASRVPAFFVFLNFVLVGVFGGLGYGNIVYWVLQKENLEKKYKVVANFRNSRW